MVNVRAVKIGGMIGLVIGGLFSLYLIVVSLVGITPNWITIYSGWQNPENFFWYGIGGGAWFLIFWLLSWWATYSMRVEKPSMEQAAAFMLGRAYMLYFFVSFFLMLLIFLSTMGFEMTSVADTDDETPPFYISRPQFFTIQPQAVYVQSVAFAISLNQEYFTDWMALLSMILVFSTGMFLLSLFMITKIWKYDSEMWKEFYKKMTRTGTGKKISSNEVKTKIFTR